MNKKILSIILGICLLGVFAGFLARAFSGHAAFPATELNASRKVLVSYFEAWQKEQPEAMYTLISARDKAVVSAVEYVQQFNDMPVAPLKYSIDSLSGAGSEVHAAVTVYWPGVEQDDMDKKQEQFFLVKEATWKINEKKSLAK